MGVLYILQINPHLSQKLQQKRQSIPQKHQNRYAGKNYPNHFILPPKSLFFPIPPFALSEVYGPLVPP